MNAKLPSRLVAYARVSSADQNPQLQLDALAKAGAARKLTFTDKVTGARTVRPGLDACLRALQPGDTLLVWRLDRLGRSLRHLIDLVADLRERGVAFRSLCDGVIDTTSASGELIFHVFVALAQFERRLIQERTRAGLEVARARGRNGGRPPLPVDHPTVIAAKKMHADRTMPVRDICRTLRISRPTLYRYLARSSSRDPVTE